VLIEWGERFPRLVRERDMEIAIERLGEQERKITVTEAAGT
jgi:tRNA A37 threonylcarbamoyladenosine biosynthesis protein TsaE